MRAKDYPEEKWPFLLRLMSLFQLSFPVDEEGQQQLVPALLPLEEPLAATEPDSAGRVRLRYEFNVVPAPLVPRPVVLYPMDLKHDCEFLYPLSPLPEWGKCWRDFEKDGDWNDALYPIGEGLKQAIKKVRTRPGR